MNLFLFLSLLLFSFLLTTTHASCPHTREQALQCIMRYVDIDGDGQITYTEFDSARHAYLGLSERFMFMTAARFILDCDANGDAVVTMADMDDASDTCIVSCGEIVQFHDHLCSGAQVAAYHKTSTHAKRQPCLYSRDDTGFMALRYLDRNHDSQISASELTYAFDTYLNATQRSLMPTLAQFYANCDTNGDKLVSWTDFQATSGTCLNTCQKLTAFNLWIITPAKTEYIARTGHVRRSVRSLLLPLGIALGTP